MLVLDVWGWGIVAKCRTCKKPDAKLRPTGKMSYYCDFECFSDHAKLEIENAEKLRIKREKQEDKKKLEVLNQTVKHWRSKAQNAFNTFIRVRDRDMPCISCGSNEEKGLVGGSFDCGHYLSTGAAPELRFTEDNAHKQCKRCNRQLSGNAIKYRIGLIEKIGEYRVSLLESYNHQPRWRWDDYKRVYDWYNRLNKIIKNELQL